MQHRWNRTAVRKLPYHFFSICIDSMINTVPLYYFVYIIAIPLSFCFRRTEMSMKMCQSLAKFVSVPPVKADKCTISLGKNEKLKTSLLPNDYPPATNE